MATVAGLGTNYNLPNFVGPLFNLIPYDTPFLSMIGGIAPGGGDVIDSTQFTWQTEDNTAASQPAIVEGADPTYTSRDRAEVTNVVQIFQYGWKAAYSKQAATGSLGPYGSSRVWSIMGDQPVRDELAHQAMLKLQRAKRDIEFSFLRGAYQLPTDNNTGRKTRGLKNAISTNALSLFTVPGTAGTVTFDYTGGDEEDLWSCDAAHSLVVGDEVQFTAVGTGATGASINTPYWIASVPDTDEFQLSATKGGAVLEGTADSSGTWTINQAHDLQKSDVDRLTREMAEGADSAAPMLNPVALTGAFNVQRVSEIYGYAPQSRTVGGVAINQVLTDFAGNLGIVFDRHMFPGDLFVVELSVCRPVFLATEGGVLFAEPLAKTGAANNWQLYGEVGLRYGPETFHGKITGCTTA